MSRISAFTLTDQKFLSFALSRRWNCIPGAAGSICKSKAVVFTAFCSSPVSRARLSVKVSAIRNSKSHLHGHADLVFDLAVEIDIDTWCAYGNDQRVTRGPTVTFKSGASLPPAEGGIDRESTAAGQIGGCSSPDIAVQRSPVPVLFAYQPGRIVVLALPPFFLIAS